MRFSALSALTVALAASSATASLWSPSKAAYNKWHETELERWLADHDVPYSTPADRKDLEKLVKENWNKKVASPYESWNTEQLQSYLSSKGQENKEYAKQNKDGLVASVKKYWYETEDQASEGYANVRDWIFDTWTDSQLKAFCDKHGIPVPQPRTRDTYLKSARENYQSAANKIGETAAYPGNWLYESWSDSDLKAWLDERGIPAPQPSKRDKLIASVRRNARYASNQAASASSSAAASASSATASLSGALFDSWSDSQLKEWLDKNGIKVPQGSKTNELRALARKNQAKLGSSASSAASGVSSSASSYYGAATSSANNAASSATEGIWGYVAWVTDQIGLGAAKATNSASSVTGQAGASASSAYDAAAASGKSATGKAGASGQSAYDAAAASAASATDRANAAASDASASGASAASAASASAASGASAASASGKSASGAAAGKAKSATGRAAKVASSASAGYHEEL